MIWHVFNTVAIPDVFPMLQRGSVARFKFNGNLKAECVVRPPTSIIAAIPDIATAREITCFIRISASIKLSRNFFPVHPGAS